MKEYVNGESGVTVKKNKEFGEITSVEDFELKCVKYTKACAVALLPASKMIDYGV
jgi:hypothetical protein